jgi:hypothetical protein
MGTVHLNEALISQGNTLLFQKEVNRVLCEIYSDICFVWKECTG